MLMEQKKDYWTWNYIQPETAEQFLFLKLVIITYITLIKEKKL